MYYFCTYFDKNYFTRGMALYQSLKEKCLEFRLWVLCLDEETYRVLSRMSLPQIQLITLEELEKEDAALTKAKSNRSKIEYYFTCTPSLPLFILNHCPQVDLITYLDADLYFFSDITEIFKEIEGCSIAIIKHNFPTHIKKMEVRGLYNVGWLSFRRDSNARACLTRWQDACNAWCYDRVEDGKFADQKYLDDWPSRFNNVVVIKHKGANVTKWNIVNYKIIASEGKVWLDTQPIIFFHFHSLQTLTPYLYIFDFNCGGAKMSRETYTIIRKFICQPYAQRLSAIQKDLLKRFKVNFYVGSIRKQISLAVFAAFYRYFKHKDYIFIWDKPRPYHRMKTVGTSRRIGFGKINFKQVLKNFIPPILLQKKHFFGSYSSWEEAVKHSIGYSSDIILNKVKESALKVKAGRMACERDSVLFDKIQYSWPLLSGILWIASQNDNRLNLIDFGGSLGSTYYQNRQFLTHLKELRWNIVEQEKFVECGRNFFENEHIKFYYTIEECIKECNPDVIILSGVLPYLEKPYELLSGVIKKGFKYIIFDRTPFLEKEVDRLTVQKVSPKIYDVSYPAWFFNRDKFLSFFAEGYDLMAEFDARAGRIYLGDIYAFEKGLVFIKK